MDVTKTILGAGAGVAVGVGVGVGSVTNVNEPLMVSPASFVLSIKVPVPGAPPLHNPPTLAFTVFPLQSAAIAGIVQKPEISLFDIELLAVMPDISPPKY